MSNQMKRGIRIVNKTGRPSDTDVYDMETGQKILNVMRVELDITQGHLDVKVTLCGPIEYEGPATIVEGESEL